MRTLNSDRKVLFGVIFAILLFTLQAVVAFAQESAKDIQIFEVRKRLQMQATDPIVRDYYVNAGQNMGLKPGAYVNVFRKTPLADPYKQETQSHVELPVGIMKVIYSDRTMAIGRIHIMRTAKESPVLDGDIFMVGDRIDLGTIQFEKSADADTGKAEKEVVKEGSKEAELAKPEDTSKREAASLASSTVHMAEPKVKVTKPAQKASVDMKSHNVDMISR